MHIKLNKTKINIIIDIFLFLLLGAISGIGFLIKYILIKGSDRNIIYGKNADLNFLGLDRHQWGNIHLILGIILLILLILHIVFHWNMILCMFKCLIPNNIFRKIIYVIISILSIIFFTFTFFIEPEIIYKEPLHLNRRNNTEKSIFNKNEQKEHFGIHKENYEYNINGRMNLQYISDQYNIDINILTNELNIPISCKDTKLGFLKKQYNFTMDDIRTIIKTHKK